MKAGVFARTRCTWNEISENLTKAFFGLKISRFVLNHPIRVIHFVFKLDDEDFNLHGCPARSRETGSHDAMQTFLELFCLLLGSDVSCIMYAN